MNHRFFSLCLGIVCLNNYSVSTRAQLTAVPKSSMPVSSINSIKVGTGKLSNCASIISDVKTLMIKIEDAQHFKQVVDGFIALIEDNQEKGHTVGRQTVAL